MFGYVIPAGNKEDTAIRECYGSYYCGICHSLKAQYGNISRFTLSYDLAFLAMLLSSLYEPEAVIYTGRCLPHPFRKHPYITSAIIDYCADMNLLLAIHKLKDDIADEHKVFAAAEEILLRKQYQQLCRKYPDKCHRIEDILTKIHAEEAKENPSIDALVNLTGEMLGIIYAYKDDFWKDTLIKIGEGLGRFIYLMDAYDDLEQDIKKNNFNPLKNIKEEENYQTFIKQTLTLLIAEATESFEMLPIESDIDILRNVLYAGIWSKYEQLQNKRIPADQQQSKPGEKA